jgi:hypothetical protein
MLLKKKFDSSLAQSESADTSERQLLKNKKPFVRLNCPYRVFVLRWLAANE